MVNALFEKHVEKLASVARRLGEAFDAAGIEYRVVGGYAIYHHVGGVDPLTARMTRDVDIAVRRSDLERIRAAVGPFGFVYRHAAGVDMLLDADEPKARSAVHFVFTGEKVRPEYMEPVPDFSNAVQTEEGLQLAPVSDLVHMKLNSFRLKDQLHLQDLDQAGLITPEIESGLSDVLRDRLAQVRASQ